MQHNQGGGGGINLQIGLQQSVSNLSQCASCSMFLIFKHTTFPLFHLLPQAICESSDGDCQHAVQDSVLPPGHKPDHHQWHGQKGDGYNFSFSHCLLHLQPSRRPPVVTYDAFLCHANRLWHMSHQLIILLML